MPGSLVVADFIANCHIIRKGASVIDSCSFRPDFIMCGLLCVLIIDCKSEGLASHVTVTAIAHYVVMEINMPNFPFSPT
jgi:hypothetical protein